MVFRELVPFRRVRPNVMIRTEPGDSSLLTLQRRMNRMFDDFFGDFGQSALGPLSRLAGEHTDFVPRMDMAETEKEYTITAELAGMDENDVQIEIQDDVLTIRGEKKVEHDEKTEQSCLKERSYGTFSRSVALGADIDQDNIDASFKKGILTVRLPKAPAEKPEAKKISIKAE